MSTSNYFRSLLLKDLENLIIPLLSSVTTMPQIYAGTPFNYHGVEHWTLQKEFLPARKTPPEGIVKSWQHYHVKSSPFMRFFLIYEGAADIRVGIDEEFATQLSEDDRQGAVGLEVLRLPAASAIYFPPGIAYSHEQFLFQENNDPQTANSQMLCIEMLDEIFVSIIIADTAGVYTTHALQLDDKQLRNLLNRYHDELKGNAVEQSWSGKVLLHKLLLNMAQQIHDELSHKSVLLRNTAWPNFDQELLTTFSTIPAKNQKLWLSISRYIDMHLDCNLEWESLAKEVGISAVHLNRIAQQATGTTIMRYVTKRRIDAAKLMLRAGTYPIKGIARFLGFRSVSSFSSSFSRHTGCSPREYRERELNPVPTKKWAHDG